MRILLSLALVGILCSKFYDSHAQCRGESDLSLKEIMKGYEYIGYLPDNPVWDFGSEKIYFEWNKEAALITARYSYSISNGNIEKIEPEDYKEIPPPDGLKSKDGRIFFEKSGDIFVYRPGKGNEPILKTFDREYLIGLNEAESGLFYSRNSNIYLLDLSTNSTTQITNFKKGSKNDDEDEDSWIEKEEKALFEIVRKRDEKEQLQKKTREDMVAGQAKAWYYSKGYLSNFGITPDGKYVIFKQVTRNQNPETHGMDFVTNEGYANALEGRAKVGLKRDDQKMGIYNVETDSVYFMDVSKLPGIYDKPAFLKEYHDGEDKYMDTYTQPKSVYYHGPYVSKTGSVVLDLKSYDNKDRWIVQVDLNSGELKNIDHQHDEAWIGGPGIVGWTSVPGTLGWFDSGDKVFFQSEESGYSHLYTYDLKRSKREQLTKGDWEVQESWLKNDQSGFWIISNEADPGEKHLYSLDIKDKSRKKITSEAGNHEIMISHDEKWAISRYSYSNKPWELYLIDIENGGAPKQITNSITEAFSTYDWRVPELVYFKAEDGAEVRARLYKPESAVKNGAAVIFVHGAGYLQNVHKWWSSYYHEYMFHNLLTDMGYTVLDIDYRGSAGYGRDWRTAIYRHMGGLDLSDQIDGANYLIAQHGIDKNRVGIYGGSYGGFITLMALFKNPGVFQGGAALRSVTDWAHYNHPYTSNILNTPEEDPTAFRRSSPIYFAEGLEDRLLMLHGMVDMNVQFQDIVRLNQRLIELEKENWELAAFPVEGHGFKEASSWHDEYRRILELFCEELE